MAVYRDYLHVNGGGDRRRPLGHQGRGLKPEWEGYLHDLRKREVSIVFRKCPPNLFSVGLEIGAGDGFQSCFLSNYVQRLVCTEYDLQKLFYRNMKNVSYMVCDAEMIDSLFRPKSFDIIFSSNLLEHLSDRKTALIKMGRILKDDGIMIHTMPNSFWKMCHLFLYYPNKVAEITELILTSGGRERILRKFGRRYADVREAKTINWQNNPKTHRKTKRFAHLVPAVHGEYNNHFQEIVSYRKRDWISLLNESGLRVLSVVDLPVSSGYGFGLERTRDLLEKVGFSSTNAYVCVKEGNYSNNSKYLSSDA